MERSKTRWADQRASSACSRATKSMSGGTGVNTGEGRPFAAGTVAPATSERIEGMHRPASDIVLAREPYGDEGPRWVVAQAEAELEARYGDLDDGERGLTAAMFDPPAGAFLVARRGDAAGPPVGGVGLRAVAPDV